VGVTGSRGKTAVARLIAGLVQLTGKQTGLACSQGSFVGQRRVNKADGGNWPAAHRLLINRAVEAAVIETGARSIVSEGLAYDRCQVAVVTNVDPAGQVADHYIETPEHMRTVLRTLVDVVERDGVAVLNGADPIAASLAPLCDGDVIFFGRDASVPAIAEHLNGDRRAVFIRDGQVILAFGRHEMPLAGIAVPADAPAARTENMLAAVAAAWGLGIAPDIIGAGVDTFEAMALA
jgi:cyanophycin synthetase